MTSNISRDSQASLKGEKEGCPSESYSVLDLANLGGPVALEGSCDGRVEGGILAAPTIERGAPTAIKSKRRA